MEEIFCSLAKTPWIQLLIASSARGLVAIQFILETGEQEARRRLAGAFPQAEFVESPETNRRAAEELEAYAAGDLQKFTVPLDLRGTGFHQVVWRALEEIPFGETRTYADIALAAERPTAFRAVGMANHSNPIPIIIPCHRVIGSNGQLVGYGGGLALKRALLEHERRYASARDLVRAGNTLPLWK
jgi:O-6-methylguanine DNA methyltransferase